MKKATKARERGAIKAWGLRTQGGRLLCEAYRTQNIAAIRGWDWPDGKEPAIVPVLITPILRTAAGGKRR